MAIYYFDIFDGEQVLRDADGVDLSSDREAARQAVLALPEIAHDELPDGEEVSFWVKVRDEAGGYFFAADMKFRATWLRP